MLYFLAPCASVCQHEENEFGHLSLLLPCSLGCPNGMLWSGLLPVPWLNHLQLCEWCRWKGTSSRIPGIFLCFLRGSNQVGLEEAHFDKQMINLPPLGHNLRKNLSCAKVVMGNRKAVCCTECC